MRELHVTAEFTIPPGQLDRFKALAAQARERIVGKSLGTLQYDWFIDDAEGTCVVQERYRDSEAVFEHIGFLGETYPALTEFCELRIVACGRPSDALRQLLSSFNAEIYAPLA